MYLQDAVAKTAFSKSTPVRLPIPTKLASGRPKSEVGFAYCTEFGNVILRPRAPTYVICMRHIYLLDVATIANRDVYRSAWMQVVVVHTVRSLISMYLWKHQL